MTCKSARFSCCVQVETALWKKCELVNETLEEKLYVSTVAEMETSGVKHLLY